MVRFQNIPRTSDTGPRLNRLEPPSISIAELDFKRFLNNVEAENHALERMLEQGLIESPGQPRMGSELEMWLVDAKTGKPAPEALKLLKALDSGARCAPELGAYNFEMQSTVFDVASDSFSQLEAQLMQQLARVDQTARAQGNLLLLTGMLPTLIPDDIQVKNRTALPRYEVIDALLTERVGGQFHIELHLPEQSIQISSKSNIIASMGCGFQPNVQTRLEDFVQMYNLMQAVSPLMLAISANSPIVFGERGYKDSRTPILEQMHVVADKDGSPRERWSLGENWISKPADPFWYNSTFLPFFSELQSESSGPLDLPHLRQQSNSVWLYNRPRFEVQNGTPTLRIEHRVPTTAPTIVDNVAHQAFLIGLSHGLLDEQKSGLLLDPTQFSFSTLKDDMLEASKHGLQATLHWQGEPVTAQQLGEALLPTARRGLLKLEINKEDIDLYLGIMQERLKAGVCPADWLVQAQSEMPAPELIKRMYQNQMQNIPLHRW